jgi:hypothetical protein
MLGLIPRRLRRFQGSRVLQSFFEKRRYLDACVEVVHNEKNKKFMELLKILHFNMKKR